MTQHLLLLTGKLAEKSLRRVLASLSATEFSWEVREMGVSVAALMSAELIDRRLRSATADRIIVPGLCAGDLGPIAARLGIPVERGPDDLKDLPAFLGRVGVTPDLSGYALQIFAEIVDAPNLDVETIVGRATRYAEDGADIIDVGCLPGTAFPHLETAIGALKEAGHSVSVDSLDSAELRRGSRAGADYVLSLSLGTLDLAQEMDATPILIPDAPGDIASLYAAMEQLEKQGKAYFADSILDPVHFGFAESLRRYMTLREQWPDAQIMMGVGNITELLDADTVGVNALLAGLISELKIDAVLTTQVSPHARTAVREIDAARRIVFAASQDGSLPKGYDPALLAVHDKKPFPYQPEEIAETAAQIRDPNYRIQVSEAGIHVYNRDGMQASGDPYTLFPQLAEIEDDPAHAFYMGVELARAQIAWQLGKRYVQDDELSWGIAGTNWQTLHADRAAAHKPAGPTLKARRAKKD